MYKPDLCRSFYMTSETLYSLANYRCQLRDWCSSWQRLILKLTLKLFLNQVNSTSRILDRRSLLRDCSSWLISISSSLVQFGQGHRDLWRQERLWLTDCTSSEGISRFPEFLICKWNREMIFQKDRFITVTSIHWSKELLFSDSSERSFLIWEITTENILTIIPNTNQKNWTSLKYSLNFWLQWSRWTICHFFRRNEENKWKIFMFTHIFKNNSLAYLR